MNFNCIFPNCTFKQNNIMEEEFLQHLNDVHYDEILDSSEKENIPVEAVRMMSVSNSKVFINSK